MFDVKSGCFKRIGPHSYVTTLVKATVNENFTDYTMTLLSKKELWLQIRFENEMVAGFTVHTTVPKGFGGAGVVENKMTARIHDGQTTFPSGEIILVQWSVLTLLNGLRLKLFNCVQEFADSWKRVFLVDKDGNNIADPKAFQFWNDKDGMAIMQLVATPGDDSRTGTADETFSVTCSGRTVNATTRRALAEGQGHVFSHRLSAADDSPADDFEAETPLITIINEPPVHHPLPEPEPEPEPEFSPILIAWVSGAAVGALALIAMTKKIHTLSKRAAAHREPAAAIAATPGVEEALRNQVNNAIQWAIQQALQGAKQGAVKADEIELVAVKEVCA